MSLKACRQVKETRPPPRKIPLLTLVQDVSYIRYKIRCRTSFFLRLSLPSGRYPSQRLSFILIKITRTRQSYFRANLLKVGLVLSNHASSAIANNQSLNFCNSRIQRTIPPDSLPKQTQDRSIKNIVSDRQAPGFIRGVAFFNSPI